MSADLGDYKHHYKDFFRKVHQQFPSISKDDYREVYYDTLKLASSLDSTGRDNNIQHYVETLCMMKFRLLNAKRHAPITTGVSSRRRKRKTTTVKILRDSVGEEDEPGVYFYINYLSRFYLINLFILCMLIISCYFILCFCFSSRGSGSDGGGSSGRVISKIGGGRGTWCWR